MNPVTRFLAQSVQPPAINVPSVDSSLIYKFIGAILILILGVALWKTTIGKVLIVGVLIYFLMRATGH